MKSKIGMETIIVRNTELYTASVDGEAVMMNIEKGSYYGLNSVGSRIWDLIEEPEPISKLISDLTQEYDVEAGTCRESIISFLSKLCDEDLIKIVG